MSMQQSPTQQDPIQNPMPITPIVQKRDKTPVIIIVLFLLATIITGSVYFLLTHKYHQQQQQQADNSSSTSQTGKNQIQWTTYTDKQHGYWFAYPQTWQFETDSTNPETFTLQYRDTTKPGEIQGAFLSQEEFSKIASEQCDPSTNDDSHSCHVYQKTESSSAYIYLTKKNDIPTNATAYITRLDGKGFSFTITKPNNDSYSAFSVIIDTLSFPSEKRSVPLFICPDSWSADQKTVMYHDITFSVEDIDTVWIKDNCQ